MNRLGKFDPMGWVTYFLDCIGIFHDRSGDLKLVMDPEERLRELNRQAGETLRKEIDDFLKKNDVLGVEVLPIQQSSYYSLRISRGGSSIAVHLNLRDIGPQIHVRGLFGDGQLGREQPFLNDAAGRAALKVALKKFFIARGGPVSPFQPQTYSRVLA